MPLYEYQCKTNGHRFEARHGMNDEPVKACPECGAEVRRVIQPVGIVFKGSGFYATDSRSSSKAVKPADGSSASPAAKDGKVTETKSDTSSGATEKSTTSGESAKPAASSDAPAAS